MALLDLEKTKSLTDVVYDRLKRAILANELKANKLYTIGKLAEEMNISRTPVREAILRLQIDGLLEIFPQRGVKIRRLTIDEAVEIFELLEILENRVMERLARDINPAELQELKAILNAQKNAKDKPVEFLNNDKKLHLRMLEMSKMNLACEFVASLADLVWLLCLETITKTPSRYDAMLVEHEAILLALEQGRAQQAKRELNLRIENIVTCVKDIAQKETETIVVA